MNYLLRKMGQKNSRRCTSAGNIKINQNLCNSSLIRSCSTLLPSRRNLNTSAGPSYRQWSQNTASRGFQQNVIGIGTQPWLPRQEYMHSSSNQNSERNKSTHKLKEKFSTNAINQIDSEDDKLIKTLGEIEPMDRFLLFQYLQLKEFTNDEISTRFDTIYGSVTKGDEDEKFSQDGLAITHSISEEHLNAFFLGRIKEIDELQEKHNSETSHDGPDPDLDPINDQNKAGQMHSFAQLESKKAMKLLLKTDEQNNLLNSVDREVFNTRLTALATDLDISRSIPISASMLLVGSSVGIIIPIMPYVVSNLGLTTGEFGMVVSSFAFAKLFANLPAAVLVEKHGRKPYLVYSLLIVSLGVGGIGLATQFEHLIICRTLTGIGVSFLSTAATLSIADSSTPLNRARTMAPMMSSFAAGAALGPAMGGILADKIGINSTFYLVGGMYLILTAVNKVCLTETKMIPEKERVFPWHQSHPGRKRRRKLSAKEENDEGVYNSIKVAVSQWRPLLANDKVRNVVTMNGFYWVALSGAQMTLLPLILTDPNGLAMSPTGVGEIYMGMSLVQVFGNPTMAKYIDKIGKVPGIVVGCSLLSASMFTLPFCTEIEQVAATLGFWALGSTMLSTAPTAYISDHVREDQRAQAIALLRTAGDIGLLVGASSTGALADVFDMDVAVHSSASLLLLATSWFTARRWFDWQQSQSKRMQ